MIVYVVTTVLTYVVNTHIELWYKSPTTLTVHACHTHVTRVCAACAKAKNKCGIKPLMYTCVQALHACKMNAPHTCTYPYEVLPRNDPPYNQ